MGNNHLRNGLIFAGLCVTTGLGFALLALPKAAEQHPAKGYAFDAPSTDHQIDPASADEPPSSDPAPSESGDSELMDQQVREPDFRESSVFKGSTGLLACSIEDGPVFQVKWSSDEEDGQIWGNGKLVTGRVSREWDPAPDVTVTTLEIDNEEKGSRLTISDDGSVSLIDKERTAEGTCRAI